MKPEIMQLWTWLDGLFTPDLEPPPEPGSLRDHPFMRRIRQDLKIMRAAAAEQAERVLYENAAMRRN